MTRKSSLKIASADSAPLATRNAFVRLDLIDVTEARLRGADSNWVHVIGRSMAEAGQLQPIRLIEKEDGRFDLNFGLARFLAAKEIGWSTIEAGIVSADAISSQQRRLAEIFENLLRNDPCALDRALMLADLKAIHEALYPETKQGGDHKQKQQLKSQNEIFSFSQMAAERTGLGQRAIQLSVSIVTGLSQDSVARLRGTPFASHQASLILLSAQTSALQAAALDILLAEQPKASTVADALVLAEGRRLTKPAEQLFMKLTTAFSRLDAKQEGMFWQTHEHRYLAWKSKQQKQS